MKCISSGSEGDSWVIHLIKKSDRNDQQAILSNQDGKLTERDRLKLCLNSPHITRYMGAVHLHARTARRTYQCRRVGK